MFGNVNQGRYEYLNYILYRYIGDRKVVQDGNLITSRGPGTAFDFGLKLAEVLTGADKAKDVARGMLLA